MQGLSEHTTHDLLNSCLLIVDDDVYLRASLRQQFVAEGFYNIYDIGCVSGLNTTVEDVNPDLILLNIKMPEENGINICKRLRSGGFTKPIVMFTEKNEQFDMVKGLEAGVNDYVAKPLRMGELLRCIYIQLRQFKAAKNDYLELADLNFVPGNKVLHKIGSVQTQELTEKETTILKFLYQAFPESVSKDEILAYVWGLQNGLTTHTLETHIYRLRQKIGRLTKAPLLITTENGYRLELSE